MNTRHDRSISLIGEKALDKLRNSTVAVVGLGGVGGLAAEALARSGIHTLILIDGDVIDSTNLNRQIFATSENVGMQKAVAARKRLLKIDPDLTIYAKPAYFNMGNAGDLLTPKPDVIIDAIDSMADKLDLIEYAHRYGIKIISAGGAGNRLSPIGMRCADLFETSGDPLCRIMRRELRNRGIDSHRVVYIPTSPDVKSNKTASMVFVPGSMGLMLAQQAVDCLLEGDQE